jgi:hypothetical protein
MVDYSENIIILLMRDVLFYSCTWGMTIFSSSTASGIWCETDVGRPIVVLFILHWTELTLLYILQAYDADALLVSSEDVELAGWLSW